MAVQDYWDLAVVAEPTVRASIAIYVAPCGTDNVGVAGVQFRIDGANFGTEVSTPPFAVAWNTAIVPDGLHTLTAVARDSAGNRTTSAAVRLSP